MINNTAEFEGLKPWERITGSSAGGFTPREMCVDIVEAMAALGCDCSDEWQELARACDDEVSDWIEDYTDLLRDRCWDALPPSCCFDWRDNELTVTPFIDDYWPRLSKLPESLLEDAETVYVVNDHGNVDCYHWNPSAVTETATGAYVHVWGMV